MGHRAWYTKNERKSHTVKTRTMVFDDKFAIGMNIIELEPVPKPLNKQLEVL
jgi:hypothetical protein